MDYQTVKKYWDEVFKNGKPRAPEKSFGNAALDAAADWLCDGADFVVDFGCGNGLALYKCALRGTKRHTGVDLSPEAIASAKANPLYGEGFDFICGDVASLEKLETDKADVAILFNIADNLLPEDTEKLLSQIHRILKPGGKLLLKLNPYITEEKITEWNIRRLDGELLDDGLFLLNRTDERWRERLSEMFIIEKYEEVYYPEYEQKNRLFRLTNR